MPYNSQLYSRCITILFLTVVALFEQIQCIRFLIITLVSLKIAFPCSNVLLSYNNLNKHISKSGLRIYTYKIFHKHRVTLGASSLMELNIASAVFVLLTCLLHQKQNTCKTSGTVSCTNQEFDIYKETYHVFGILP
jgi:hypothetical protein